MNVVGYTYPDGYALCVIHAWMPGPNDLEGCHPIFDTDEDAIGLYCDECLEPLVDSDGDSDSDSDSDSDG